MAIVVEDGTGLPNSVSYASVAEADAYFLAKGNLVWAALTNAAKEVALVNATDYIDTRWFHALPGTRPNETQALEFPRTLGGELYLPKKLRVATSEYAVRASDGPLAPDIVYDDTNRLVSRKLEETGPIKEDISYTGRSAFASQWRTYPTPDGIMQTFLRNAIGTVIRA
jgi:hypothetical protein